METNPQKNADLLKFTSEIFIEKLRYSAEYFLQILLRILNKENFEFVDFSQMECFHRYLRK